jgi:hypothetical protein
MKKKSLLLIALVAAYYASMAQITSYDLSTVPENVKKNASVIKRYENNVFEALDIERASLKMHKIVTIVDKKGEEALLFRISTDKFVSIEDLEIKTFDSKGKQLNKYKKKDLRSIAISENLIDDSKTNYLSVATSGYPVTVEYKYELRYRGTYMFPRYLILTPGLGLESSTYTVKVAKALDFRYRNINVEVKPEISEDEKYKTYKWSVKNLPAFEDEEGSAEYSNFLPSVLFSPNKFKFDDYEGDLSSWKNFGLWINKLYQGLDVLPEERKLFFRDLVKDARSDREKTKLIYNYLQKNFRYVSIQLGIGGLRPFSADFTDKKKYGDCKALSNYMKAALNTVGIKGYNAVINSQYNSEPVDPDFPSDQFNHVILCVPQPDDTIWLECTSQTSEFDVLGTFTENRNALLLTENGGVLVPTPKSKSSDNTFNSSTTILMDADGSGKTNTIIHSTGSYKELMNAIMDEKKDDQQQALIYAIGLKQPDEFSIAKKEENGNLHTAIALNHQKIPDFIAGNKMFLSPRIYSLWVNKLPKGEGRKMDYYFRSPFEKTDTTVFKLPEGYTPDALPQSKDLKNDYISYSTKYWYDDIQKAVYSTARLILRQHRIPAMKFAEIKKICDEISKENAQKIVIKKG